MRSKITLGVGLIALSFAMVSCSDDDDDDDPVPSTPTVTIPTSYVSPNYTTNAAQEDGVRDELNALVSAMKQADGGNVVNLADLQNAWNGTTLQVVTASGYTSEVDGFLTELADASTGGTFDPSQAPNSKGFFGNHLLNSYGVESEQMVEKALFAAALYNHALTVVKGTRTPASSDQLVSIFGANPNFPNSDKISTDPDIFSAKYAARRTPLAGGVYLDIKNNLITAKAYLDASVSSPANAATYNAEALTAMQQFLRNWEVSSAATSINYFYAAIDGLSGTNPTVDEQADAMHAYSEGVAFLYGWYFLSESDRLVSNSDIEDIMVDLLYPVNGTPEAYRFITEPAQTLPSMESAINKLAAIYGFTQADLCLLYTSPSPRD